MILIDVTTESRDLYTTIHGAASRYEPSVDDAESCSRSCF